jgi:DNA replication and repair protein RecF
LRVTRLWLTDFRNYVSADIDLPADGLTVVLGGNGEGKTNLLEALGYLATLTSFRGAPTEALVRSGASQAIVRAEGERDGRRLLVEAEVAAGGRGRVLVNGQPLRRARDLLGAFRVTVFAPDDLELVKGGPSGRREYLDDLLVALAPRNGELKSDLERIVRQRNALLKQAGGRLTTEITDTLDVWDSRLATTGTALAEAREALVADLDPELSKSYDQVAHTAAAITVAYERSWGTATLADALLAARPDDIRRCVTTVGPHRDELHLSISQLPARTHASQGEQRSLALALRLAGHAVVTEAIGTPPTLLLDDVFSELDPARSAALLAHLPAGQAVLTTAGPVPEGSNPQATVRVRAGSATVVTS